jgi:hypothetical protein
MTLNKVFDLGLGHSLVNMVLRARVVKLGLRFRGLRVGLVDLAHGSDAVGVGLEADGFNLKE